MGLPPMFPGAGPGPGRVALLGRGVFICRTQAHGRDAVDVALTTSFGPTKLETFKVWTDEVT